MFGYMQVRLYGECCKKVRPFVMQQIVDERITFNKEHATLLAFNYEPSFNVRRCPLSAYCQHGYKQKLATD